MKNETSKEKGRTSNFSNADRSVRRMQLQATAAQNRMHTLTGSAVAIVPSGAEELAASLGPAVELQRLQEEIFMRQQAQQDVIADALHRMMRWESSAPLLVPAHESTLAMEEVVAATHSLRNARRAAEDRQFSVNAGRLLTVEPQRGCLSRSRAQS
eukprot:TRINITY_DN26552_c0_g1_i1.p1 TRINITY_DN26552_c0_g1~~TRINITY_DN26552_c0_g1_i1.p1  ORF type:complete len:165 (-),score=30.83 TRINITY_DN26552_c0_g1_i1:138-605(-)